MMAVELFDREMDVDDIDATAGAEIGRPDNTLMTLVGFLQNKDCFVSLPPDLL